MTILEYTHCVGHHAGEGRWSTHVQLVDWSRRMQTFIDNLYLQDFQEDQAAELVSAGRYHPGPSPGGREAGFPYFCCGLVNAHLDGCQFGEHQMWGAPVSVSETIGSIPDVHEEVKAANGLRLPGSTTAHSLKISLRSVNHQVDFARHEQRTNSFCMMGPDFPREFVARAGYFYTGLVDGGVSLACYSCGFPVVRYTVGMDLAGIHRRFFPHCEHVNNIMRR